MLLAGRIELPLSSVCETGLGQIEAVGLRDFQIINIHNL
jgi:hypothetical protein